MSPDRPVTMLIAALGGEGGGVLTDWIIAAATDVGLPVQSTSIPGVAQRTATLAGRREVAPSVQPRSLRFTLVSKCTTWHCA